ncbi:hypothetical protein L873DRAFT_1822609 [Choiromyces venosus 120613-1]|uniref:Uncharacterized protein n=1 Tax=Choiromyces venosus 120613-1 TaxID=1336337 RepID=A0A3N4IX66_9PEZI|nr:hypothetical protein L873DRAFT_1822609 [Choiromyces venosus 120613-1]
MPQSSQQQLEVWISKRSYEIGFGENGTFVGKKVLLQKLLRDRFKFGFACCSEEEIRLALARLCNLGLAKKLNDDGAARARDLRELCDLQEEGRATGSTPTPRAANGISPATPAATANTASVPASGRVVPPASTSQSPDFFDSISETVEVRPLEPIPTEPMKGQSPNLPYCVQHNITTSLQSILEGACFKYAKSHVPDLLIRKRWTCAHSAELSMWTKELSKTFEQKPSSIRIDKIGGKAQLPVLLKSLDDLRHSAVHRIPVQADKLVLFIHAALQVAEILGDEEKQSAINAILNAVHTAVDKQRVEKEKIECALTDQLQKIELQKKQLDQEAQDAKKQAEKLTAQLDDELGAIISQELPVGIMSH